MLKGHGDDTYAYKNIRLNFSSNVNPSGVSPLLANHLKKQISALESYPEPLAGSLAGCIERQEMLSEGSALVTNGAVEAFYLLAAWKQGKRSVIYVPSFSEYDDACLHSNHAIEYRHHASFMNADYEGVHMVWLCSPNNPDGKIYDFHELTKQIAAHPHTVFVVDEAYCEFVKRPVSLVSRTNVLENLVVVRSMTKRFAIPGLRLGYIIANPEIIGELEKQLMPWRINTLALEAGLFCLSEHYDDALDMEKWIEESSQLQAKVAALEGFSVEPSRTVFFLAKAPCKASILKDYLAREYGILIRDASNFRRLSDYHFRISVKSPLENDQLIKALKEWNHTSI